MALLIAMLIVLFGLGVGCVFHALKSNTKAVWIWIFLAIVCFYIAIMILVSIFIGGMVYENQY